MEKRKEFGMNRFLMEMLISISTTKYIGAKITQAKIKKKFSQNSIKVGLFTKVINSSLGKFVFLGKNVDIINSKIDDHSYVGSNSEIKDTSIGKFCSISSEVRIGLGLHPTNFVSTHPAFFSNNKIFKTFSDENYFDETSNTIIENDVWIGYNVIIPGGIKIGTGAIIATGAVVTKDVEPFSIVGGIPAKHIRYRFSKNTIIEILKSKWWEKDEKWFMNNFKLFHNPDEFIKENKI